MFDVLDENGRFINKIAGREECHKKGLWHRAVVAHIINSKQQVLLQKRSATKKLWPNLWDVTAGGHVLSRRIWISVRNKRDKRRNRH